MLKKFIYASVAVFVAVTLLNMLLHSVILSGLYTKSAAIWRPMNEMMKLMWVMHVATLISSVCFTYIYYKLIGNKTPFRGLWYGLTYGIAVGVGMAYSTYAMLPMPYALAVSWFLGAIVTYGIAGWIAGMIIKE